MINFTTIRTSADMKRYYVPDYLLESASTHAFFAGKMCDRLGLGEFDRTQFERMCDGWHPTKKETLTARKRLDARAGFDVTVDGPKDLGVLMALGMDDRIVPMVLERSARDLIALIEKSDASVRVRKGGADTDRPTGEVAVTGLLHLTSRPVGNTVDMNPHLHLLFHNVTWDAVDGKRKALQLQPFASNGSREARPFYTAFLNNQMAMYMQELGYTIAPDKKTGTFKVVGVPESVRQQFSQRTRKIEAVAKKLEEQKQAFMGDDSVRLDPAVKGRLGAHTREPKQPGKSWESLLAHWESRVSPTEREAIAVTVKAAVQPVKPPDRSREAVTFALEHLTERNTVVPERHVVTQALKFGLGSVTPESIYKELGSRKDVIRRTHDGQAMVTTTKALAWEKLITSTAVKGRGRLSPLRGVHSGMDAAAGTMGSERLRVAFDSRLNSPAGFGLAETSPDHRLRPGLDATIPAGSSAANPDLATLSPSQSIAVRHVWASRDRITVVQGRAGTGKTTLTKTAVAGIRASGKPVQMLAPTASASRGVLRKDGFQDADTLAAFLNSREMQERVRGGVIWLDEAGLASVKDFAALCQSADSLNARIVVSGDSRQHKSVAAGDVLALLDRAGLPVAEVTEIKRQQPGKYREVAELFAAGKANTGLAQLMRHGWVKESGIVEDYLAALEAGKTALVVCPTHAEGERVTEQIRDRLKATGTITEEREVRRLKPMNLTAAELREAKKQPEEGVVYQKFAAYREEKQKLGVGDVIRATAPLKDFAKRDIDTGTVMTVAGWTPGGNMRVKTASGADRLLDADCGHVAPAYVSTSHASQGRTVDRVLLWMPEASFPAVNQAAAYVGVTRGRERVTLYTDDLEGLREVVQREDHRPSASELVRINPRGVRQRLKRHVGWLRSLGVEVKRKVLEPVVELTRARDNHYQGRQ